MSDSVQPHGLQPTRLLRPWDSPGKNTGVGCHFLLQYPYTLELTKWLRLAYLTLFTLPHLDLLMATPAKTMAPAPPPGPWPFCFLTNTVSESLHDKQGPSLYGTCECLTLIISKLHSCFLLWPRLTLSYQTNIYVLTTLNKGKTWHNMFFFLISLEYSGFIMLLVCAIQQSE